MHSPVVGKLAKSTPLDPSFLIFNLPFLVLMGSLSQDFFTRLPILLLTSFLDVNPPPLCDVINPLFSSVAQTLSANEKLA